MKKISILIVAVIVICTVFSVCINANSVSADAPEEPIYKTQFELNEMSEEEKKTTYQSLRLSVLESEPEYHSISTYALRADGGFSIASQIPNIPDGSGGLNNPDGFYYDVCVFSNSGEFEYGFNVDSSGWFGIEFDGHNIVLLFWNGDNTGSAICLDSKGSQINSWNFTHPEDFREYDVYNADEKKLGENTYHLESDSMFSPKTKLVKINENGEKTVLLDIGKTGRELLLETLEPFLSIWPVIIVAPLVYILSLIIIKRIKLEQKRKSGDGSVS